MVNMLDIVKSDVGTLGNWLAAGNSPSHILQVLVTRRQLGVDEVRIEGAIRHVRERRHWQLLIVHSVRHDAESAGLCQASGGAGVGAEACEVVTNRNRRLTVYVCLETYRTRSSRDRTT